MSTDPDKPLDPFTDPPEVQPSASVPPAPQSTSPDSLPNADAVEDSPFTNAELAGAQPTFNDIEDDKDEAASLSPEVLAFRARRKRKRKRESFTQDLAARGLVLAWCLWLLGSWVVTLQIDSPVPAARLMVFSALIAVTLLWPLLRLTADLGKPRAMLTPDGAASNATAPDDPGAASGIPLVLLFSDWLSLVLIFQAVIWPLRLNTGWSMNQAIWLDAAFAGWTLLAGALAALGGMSRRVTGRVCAMILCLCLLFGEPLLLAAINTIQSEPIAWTMRVSPFEAFWAMTDRPVAWSVRPWSERVIAVGVAAVLAWGIVALMKLRREPQAGTSHN